MQGLPVRGRARNYLFTIMFTPDESGKGYFAEEPRLLDLEQLPTWVTYCVYQLEVAQENGYEHFQGYLECRGEKSYGQIHEIPGFGRAHLEMRRGTQDQAIEYCKKPETRVDGPWEVGVPKAQGKRNDLLEVKEKVDLKRPLREIHEEHFGTMIRYGRAIKEYKRTITKARDFKSKVYLFIGPPGKGKSTLMKLIAAQLGTVYKAPMPKGSGQYFDDYDGQDVLILDEFDGNRMKPNDFNELCDEHECVLTVHGGAGHQMVSKYIFVGTNYLPKQWWKNRNAVQLRQTTRRIDVTFKVGFREGPARQAVQYDPDTGVFEAMTSSMRK